MVSERNRVIELKEYIQSLGIDVNIGKTKARGNNGVFMHGADRFRIDISKNLPEENVLSVLIHELAHFVHYSFDKKLKSLDFIFGDFDEDLREELIKITVQNLPKEFAATLFNTKKILNEEIKQLSKEIKIKYPEFKSSERFKPIEKNIKYPFSYLLKYDNVKVFADVYSVRDIEKYDSLDDCEIKYIRLRSKQRQINRINSKISRLNKYYNNYSELFARFTESYFLNNEITKEKAPKAFNKMKNCNIEVLKNMENILFCKSL